MLMVTEVAIPRCRVHPPGCACSAEALLASGNSGPAALTFRSPLHQAQIQRGVVATVCSCPLWGDMIRPCLSGLWVHVPCMAPVSVVDVLQFLCGRGFYGGSYKTNVSELYSLCLCPFYLFLCSVFTPPHPPHYVLLLSALHHVFRAVCFPNISMSQILE